MAVTAASPHALVVAAVQRCRRRLAWLMFVRATSVSVAVSGVAVAAWSFWSGTPPTEAAGLWTVALVFAAAAAGAVTLIRAPTLAATAAAVDAALHLEDRTTAALQFEDLEDPVATLIALDSSARLAPVAPHVVFPLAVAQRRWMLALPGGSALLVIAATLAPHAAESGSAAWAAAGAGSTGMARPVDGPPDGASAATLSNADTGARGSRSQRARAAAAPAATRREKPSVVPASADSSSRDRAQPAAPFAEAAGGMKAPAAGDPLSTRSAGVGPGSTSGAQSGALRAGAAVGGGGGESTSSLVRSGSGGGSAIQAALTGDAPRGVRATSPAFDRPSYRAAWVAAEAGLARGQVPSERRQYVRNYFAAIRPNQPE